MMHFYDDWLSLEGNGMATIWIMQHLDNAIFGFKMSINMNFINHDQNQVAKMR